MSLILGIETGTDVCSVSLSRDGRLISLRESGEERNHARTLGIYIDEILKANGCEPEELDAVALGKGPGSYTGLRIGASTAKGLCYALGIPLIAVGSLESLAYVAAEDSDAGILDIDNRDSARFCPMLDARRMEVYAQVFDPSLCPLTETEAHIITPESFGEFIDGVHEFIVFGTGAAKCAGILSYGSKVKYAEVIPSARGLVKPACKAFVNGQFEDIAYFEPLYLKDFVTTTPKRRQF